MFSSLIGYRDSIFFDFTRVRHFRSEYRQMAESICVLGWRNSKKVYIFLSTADIPAGGNRNFRENPRLGNIINCLAF